MEYAYGGTGIGTVSLPMGGMTGGNLGRNVMNVMDIFNSVGRMLIIGLLSNAVIHSILSKTIC